MLGDAIRGHIDAMRKSEMRTKSIVKRGHIIREIGILDQA